jgi:hypothetical protein
MKTTCGYFEKGHETHKNKQIIFKNKIETDVPNKIFFSGTHEFCFTNVKSVLQKYVSNKPYNPRKGIRITCSKNGRTAVFKNVQFKQ